MKWLNRKAILYTRVSSDDQKNNNSLADQLDRLQISGIAVEENEKGRAVSIGYLKAILKNGINVWLKIKQ